jgi:mono/diheme cytochrome c family protein
MMTVSNTMNRTTMVAGSAALATIVVTAMMFTLAPQSAQAHPAYAEKTGQHCAICHVNPKGGGKLSDCGTKWLTHGMKASFKCLPKSKK